MPDTVIGAEISHGLDRKTVRGKLFLIIDQMYHGGKNLQAVFCLFIRKLYFRKISVPHALSGAVFKNPLFAVFQSDQTFCKQGDPVLVALQDIFFFCFRMYLNLPILIQHISSLQNLLFLIVHPSIFTLAITLLILYIFPLFMSIYWLFSCIFSFFPL